MEVGVSFSVYDITVPVMVHGLNVMDDYLDHAQALERTKGLEPGSVLGERLAPDMQTFGEQFSVSCNKGRRAHGEAHASRTASSPEHPDDESPVEKPPLWDRRLPQNRPPVEGCLAQVPPVSPA